MKQRIEMIEKSNSNLSITNQCNLLGVNRSTLYYKPVSENKEDLEIIQLLKSIYTHAPFYGALKLTALLRQLNYQVNIKRVRRLMKKSNWQTLYQQPCTTQMDKAAYKYPYLLRDMEINRANQVWQTDITYIPMQKGFMYLIAIIDVHSRYIVNWSLSNTMTAAWCTQVMSEAIQKHGKPQIVNTDQGCQFTSEIFINCLKNNNIKISMDGKGRALDNIFIERFWRTVKYENIYLNVYENGLSLRKGLTNYFDFYNNHRLHQSLNYQPPFVKYGLAENAENNFFWLFREPKSYFPAFPNIVN